MHRTCASTCDHMARLHAGAAQNRSEAIKASVQTNACACRPVPLFARNSQGKNSGDRPLGSGGSPHITPPPRLERALTAGQAAATVPVVVHGQGSITHISDGVPYVRSGEIR